MTTRKALLSTLHRHDMYPRMSSWICLLATYVCSEGFQMLWQYHWSRPWAQKASIGVVFHRIWGLALSIHFSSIIWTFRDQEAHQSLQSRLCKMCYVKFSEASCIWGWFGRPEIKDFQIGALLKLFDICSRDNYLLTEDFTYSLVLILFESFCLCRLFATP